MLPAPSRPLQSHQKSVDSRMQPARAAAPRQGSDVKVGSQLLERVWRPSRFPGCLRLAAARVNLWASPWILQLTKEGSNNFSKN